MPNTKFMPPKGFRDLLPKQMAIRNRVINTLKEVFESYGFQPLQTPTLEYGETLMGKYGEEADKLLYLFEDRGGRRVGLNYDLTVPTARVLSAYQELPKPFKRYQIQSSYRAENTQKGRYRQFTQCDIDTIGSSSPLADAEILAVIYTCLNRLGLPNFVIKVNSRPVLYQLMEKLGFDKQSWNSILQTVDKSDKQTPEQLDIELSKKGFGEKVYSTKIAPELDRILDGYKTNGSTTDTFLDQVIKLAQQMGVNPDNLSFSPAIVRGLDYYTGPIFETVVKEPKIGSVTGGGRYDKLINQLGGPDLPATGTTIGLDRICDVIEELNLWPSLNETARVLVTVFNETFLNDSLKTAEFLRENGISTEVYLDFQDRLDKQLKFANKKNIPFVVIIGEEEAKNQTLVLKNMSTGEQQLLTPKELVQKLE